MIVAYGAAKDDILSLKSIYSELRGAEKWIERKMHPEEWHLVKIEIVANKIKTEIV